MVGGVRVDCERRIKVFVKIPKKKNWGLGSGLAGGGGVSGWM